MAVAACWEASQSGEASPEDWFPERGAMGKRHQRARQICISRCAIKDECLIWALEQMKAYRAEGSLFGIWGGTTHLEREQMLRNAA